MHFNFVATDHFNLKVFSSVENFVNHFPDIQTVWLKDEKELDLLFDIMGIHDYEIIKLDSPIFPRCWDISKFKLPEFNSEQYELFFEQWITKSKREQNMNEYGNLLFMQGLTPQWNKLKSIIQEEN